MKVTWKPITIVEILLTVGTAVYYLVDPYDFLSKVVQNESEITPAAENVLRLMATTILTQTAMLVVSLSASSAVSAKRMLYWGMTVGDFGLLIVYYIYFFQHGKQSAISFMPIFFSFLFGVFRLVVLLKNPRWWSWQ
jgi:hypothetical protein